MGFFNITSSHGDSYRWGREGQTQTGMPMLFTYNRGYSRGDLAQNMKERREAQERHEAKLKEENTKYLKKFAAPLNGELQSLPDLLSAKKQIGQFKYYRNCTEQYDTSEIDNLLYALEKQENGINNKINNINTGEEDENSSMYLYTNLQRDLLA